MPSGSLAKGLAHMLHSLVRVSRRVRRGHLNTSSTGTQVSIYDHATCISTTRPIKNGSNVIGHVQPVHYFCTINKNGEYLIWRFVYNSPNRQNKHTVNYSAYTVYIKLIYYVLYHVYNYAACPHAPGRARADRVSYEYISEA